MKIIQIATTINNEIIGLDTNGVLWKLEMGDYVEWQKMISSPK